MFIVNKHPLACYMKPLRIECVCAFSVKGLSTPKRIWYSQIQVLFKLKNCYKNFLICPEIKQ